MELSEESLARFFYLTSPFLDECQRRLVAASVADVLGRGGQAPVATAAGISRNTVIGSARELAEHPLLQDRVRRPGAGPKRRIDVDPELLAQLSVGKGVFLAIVAGRIVGHMSVTTKRHMT